MSAMSQLAPQTWPCRCSYLYLMNLQLPACDACGRTKPIPNQVDQASISQNRSEWNTKPVARKCPNAPKKPNAYTDTFEIDSLQSWDPWAMWKSQIDPNKVPKAVTPVPTSTAKPVDTANQWNKFFSLASSSNVPPLSQPLHASTNPSNQGLWAGTQAPAKPGRVVAFPYASMMASASNSSTTVTNAAQTTNSNNNGIKPTLVELAIAKPIQSPDSTQSQLKPKQSDDSGAIAIPVFDESRFRQIWSATMPQTQLISIDKLAIDEGKQQTNAAIIRGFALKYNRNINRCANWMFHGASYDSIVNICKNGFDRLYNRRFIFGKGNYFTSSAKYADRYATRDESGLQHMIVCRVAIGDMTVGTQEMTEPPKKADGTEYDVLVDRLPKPTICSVYRDYHAIPQFLITYQ